MSIIVKVILVAAALLLSARYVPGISVESFYTAFIVAVLLGFINLIVRPVLLLLALPVNLITFGLFTFVINALLFWGVSTFVEGFTVAGFIPAFLGAFV